MIKSFKCKEAEKIFHRNYSKKFSESVNDAAFLKLRILNRAVTLNDLRVPPGNKLEKIKGERAGQFSIRINDQYRICFHWSSQDAFDVEIVDYH